MIGRLTTHVLDLSQGCPASGLKVQLWQLEDGQGRLLREAVTNADGRLDSPLLEGTELIPGNYELLFMAGAYFRRNVVESAMQEVNSLFDQIPIRFHIEGTDAHYHIPLLVAPGGYSTYRGS